jgi:hypothetical protein
MMREIEFETIIGNNTFEVIAEVSPIVPIRFPSLNDPGEPGHGGEVEIKKVSLVDPLRESPSIEIELYEYFVMKLTTQGQTGIKYVSVEKLLEDAASEEVEKENEGS